MPWIVALFSGKMANASSVQLKNPLNLPLQLPPKNQLTPKNQLNLPLQFPADSQVRILPRVRVASRVRILPRCPVATRVRILPKVRAASRVRILPRARAASLVRILLRTQAASLHRTQAASLHRTQAAILLRTQAAILLRTQLAAKLYWHLLHVGHPTGLEISLCVALENAENWVMLNFAALFVNPESNFGNCLPSVKILVSNLEVKSI